MKGILKYTILYFLLFTTFSATAAGVFFNVAVSGSTLTITTTIPNHTYGNAGIKLNTAGYSLSSGCTPANNGYCLFSVSDTAAKTITVNGSSGTLNITLCLNGKAPLSCQSYNVVVASSSFSSFAYVTDLSNVQSCPIQSNGTFATCTPNGGFSTAVGIAFNPDNNKIYIGNNGSDTVSFCSIDSSGLLSGCSLAGGGFDGPDGIAIGSNSGGAFAVISNAGSNLVTVAPIGSTGVFGTVGSNGPFLSPRGLAVNNVGGRVYIANYAANRVSSCGIVGTSIGPCTLSIPAFNGPYGVAINSLNTRLYVTNNTGDNVSICELAGGNIASCQPSTQSFTGPLGIALNAANTKAYIAFNNNSVSVCDINATDGMFISCTTASTSYTLASYLVIHENS